MTAAAETRVTVRFQRRAASGEAPRAVEVPSGTPLIEAVRRAGLPIASACGAEGVCGRCALQILEGAEAVPAETGRDREVRHRNRIDDGLRLACRTPVVGPLLVTASWW